MVRSIGHVVLKPPGQRADDGSREILRVQVRWEWRKALVGGKDAYFSFGMFYKICFEQLLKYGNTFATQHGFVEMLVCGDMRE
jgi:hypothetical protein